MYEKDLKKLTRQELLELLLEQSKRIDRLNIKITELEEQLEKKEVAFKESGNLAEAALKVSGYFEAAQKAADYYVRQLEKEAGATGKNGADFSVEQEDKTSADKTDSVDFSKKYNFDNFKPTKPKRKDKKASVPSQTEESKSNKPKSDESKSDKPKSANKPKAEFLNFDFVVDAPRPSSKKHKSSLSKLFGKKK